jgi:hypothetical protein
MPGKNPTDMTKAEYSEWLSQVRGNMQDISEEQLYQLTKNPKAPDSVVAMALLLLRERQRSA